jgi:threonine-phosphate decarboxylase
VKKENALEIDRCEHGGRVKEYSTRLGLPEEEILDFSANINPLGLPKRAESVYHKAFQTLRRYPDDSYREFRQAAAHFLEAYTNRDINPKHILPGNGSIEILGLAVQMIINPGDTVLIPTPTFGEYERQSRLFGANVRFVDQERLFKLRENDLGGIKAAFICNPNNPTGRLRGRQALKSFMDKLRVFNTFLVVDEAFIELSQPDESVIDLAISQDNILVLRSLTKCFSIPGLRLGYGVGSEGLIEVLNRARIAWNLNAVASFLGTYLLQNNDDFLAESRDFINGERKWLKGELTRLGFKVYPSDTNFLLLNISSSGLSSTELVNRVSLHGILLRDARSFRGLDDRHIRLAIRTREENRQLIEAIGSEIVG